MRDIVSYSVVPSPLGDLTLTSDGSALTGLYLADAAHARVPEPSWVRDDASLREVARQLAEYFAGTRSHFDIPLAPSGTPFQRSVWQVLRAIPFGQTLSYAELAQRIGARSAVRAVGAANGKNPISIIVPCHRVIGSDGSLTGYAGGLPRKRWLLSLEGAAFGPSRASAASSTARG
jgi:methylated-DNA-[protein]-cysteine S-methyltransferase